MVGRSAAARWNLAVLWSLVAVLMGGLARPACADGEGLKVAVIER